MVSRAMFCLVSAILLDITDFWIMKYYNKSYVSYLLKSLTSLVDGDRDHFHIEGLMESPATDDEGECFSPLLLNATSVNIEVYYNKAVNYTLMVTFVSFMCDISSILLIHPNVPLARFGGIP